MSDPELERIKGMSDEEVLGELRNQGVNSLEDLVSKTMEAYRSAETTDEVSRTFIYKQFIYHEQS